jgi:hypothetical protein
MDHSEDDIEFGVVAVGELTEWEGQEVLEVREDDQDHSC